MKKLSVVIITFNEEKHIIRCIDSVRAIADEIVVVDSFSTDKTKELCLSRNITFIEHAFGGYIAQKNYALTRASNAYVLSLDADEAVSEYMGRFINHEKQAGFTCDGYEFNRLTHYCGKWIKHGTWYPDRKLRLFNRHKGEWQGIDPHDQYVLQNGATIKRLSYDILHYSYDTLQSHIKQFNHFSNILAHEMHLQGKPAPFFKLLFNPLMTFIKSYILRMGMLDGYFGFIIAAFSAFATFAKYAKLREFNKKKHD